MPRFSARSMERLETCHPELQRLFRVVVRGFDCTILCGHRGEAEQNKAFASGRSRLRWPNSKHNGRPSLSVDVAPYPLAWGGTMRIYRFAGYVRGVAYGLGIRVRWGGDWDGDTDLSDQRFNDLPHFELVEG